LRTFSIDFWDFPCYALGKPQKEGDNVTQGERIKEVRKALGLTLEKFGERIGVGKSTISDLENGRRSLSEHMTKSICREFHVDYIWLTTGEGDMFLDADDDFMEQIDQIMASETDARKNLFKFMLTLSEDDVKAMQRLMRKAFEFYKDDDPEKDNTKG
jgi:transcriptional regulator with XRE-family HTH domain